MCRLERRATSIRYKNCRSFPIRSCVLCVYKCVVYAHFCGFFFLYSVGLYVLRVIPCIVYYMFKIHAANRPVSVRCSTFERITVASRPAPWHGKSVRYVLGTIPYTILYACYNIQHISYGYICLWTIRFHSHRTFNIFMLDMYMV